MTPDLTLTIKANPALTTEQAVSEYLDELIADYPALANYRSALGEIVNAREDHRIEIYAVPAMDGDFISSCHGTRLLWMPDIYRAALSAYQSSGWDWTDASDPEDALRRYANDDMMP